jgi:hypothetical protein
MRITVLVQGSCRWPFVQPFADGRPAKDASGGELRNSGAAVVSGKRPCISRRFRIIRSSGAENELCDAGICLCEVARGCQLPFVDGGLI